MVLLVAMKLVGSTYSLFARMADFKTKRRLAVELFREKIKAAQAVRVEREQAAISWKGFRKFLVQRKVLEGEGICSFYLVPHDNKPLPLFRPGQFLTFRLKIPGQDKPVVRCYSLSDCPRSDYYRVTIKRVPPRTPKAPPGLVSNYFHDHVQEGDILDCQAPGGIFYLDPMYRRPVVLIGGGVGITPMYSMLSSICQANSNRETWLFYGVRHGGEHALRAEIDQLVAGRENVKVVTCYSNPGPQDVLDRDFHHQDRVSVELIKAYTKTNNYQFYMCGPPAMMESVVHDLHAWGVPKEDIFLEEFGPPSKKKSPPVETIAAASGQGQKVTFAKSNKTVVCPEGISFEDLTNEHGISISYGCHIGNCMTCSTAVKSGKVKYPTHQPNPETEEGCCLPCIAVADGDVTLDA